MTSHFFINLNSYDIEAIFVKGMEYPFKVSHATFDMSEKTVTFQTLLSQDDPIPGTFTFDFDAIAGVRHKAREGEV